MKRLVWNIQRTVLSLIKVCGIYWQLAEENRGCSRKIWMCFMMQCLIYQRTGGKKVVYGWFYRIPASFLPRGVDALRILTHILEILPKVWVRYFNIFNFLFTSFLMWTNLMIKVRFANIYRNLYWYIYIVYNNNVLFFFLMFRAGEIEHAKWMAWCSVGKLIKLLCSQVEKSKIGLLYFTAKNWYG